MATQAPALMRDHSGAAAGAGASTPRSSRLAPETSRIAAANDSPSPTEACTFFQ